MSDEKNEKKITKSVYFNENASQLYNEHIFAITHELRTPLAVLNSTILNHMETLRKLYRSLDDKTKHNETFKQLKEDMFLFESQVDDIENFIKLLAEHRDYSTNKEQLVNIKCYLDHILNISHTFCREMSIFSKNNVDYADFKGEDFENIWVIINPTELNRIFMNIFKNAAEAIHEFYQMMFFKNSNYIPTLKIRCVKATKNTGILYLKNTDLGPIGSNNTQCALYIVIEDNGPGISPEMMKKLFLNGSTTKVDDAQDNLGFGLYYCKQLAEKNDISIFVQSKEHEYTRFIIGFPEMFISSNEDMKTYDDETTKLRTSLYGDYSLLKWSTDSLELTK